MSKAVKTPDEHTNRTVPAKPPTCAYDLFRSIDDRRDVCSNCFARRRIAPPDPETMHESESYYRHAGPGECADYFCDICGSGTGHDPLVVAGHVSRPDTASREWDDDAPPERDEWYLVPEDIDVDPHSCAREMVLDAARSAARDRQDPPLPDTESLVPEAVDVAVREQRELEFVPSEEIDRREEQAVFDDYDISGALQWVSIDRDTVQRMSAVLQTIDETECTSVRDLADQSGVPGGRLGTGSPIRRGSTRASRRRRASIDSRPWGGKRWTPRRGRCSTDCNTLCVGRRPGFDRFFCAPGMKYNAT